MSLFLKKGMIKKVPFLSNGSDELITRLVAGLVPRFAVAGEVLIAIGEIGTEMFMLDKGGVEVWIETTEAHLERAAAAAKAAKTSAEKKAVASAEKAAEALQLNKGGASGSLSSPGRSTPPCNSPAPSSPLTAAAEGVAPPAAFDYAKLQKVVTLGEGSFFGEIALLLPDDDDDDDCDSHRRNGSGGSAATAANVRTSTVVATRASELFVLSRAHFLAVLAAFPEFRDVVRKSAKARLARDANNRQGASGAGGNRLDGSRAASTTAAPERSATSETDVSGAEAGGAYGMEGCAQGADSSSGGNKSRRLTSPLNRIRETAKRLTVHLPTAPGRKSQVHPGAAGGKPDGAGADGQGMESTDDVQSIVSQRRQPPGLSAMRWSGDEAPSMRSLLTSPQLMAGRSVGDRATGRTRSPSFMKGAVVHHGVAAAAAARDAAATVAAAAAAAGEDGPLSARSVTSPSRGPQTATTLDCAAMEQRIVHSVRESLAADVRLSEDRIVARLLAALRGSTAAAGGDTSARAAGDESSGVVSGAVSFATEAELCSVVE